MNTKSKLALSLGLLVAPLALVAADAAERDPANRVDTDMDAADQSLVLHLNGRRIHALIKADLIEHFRSEAGGDLSVKGAVINNLATIRALAATKHTTTTTNDIELSAADLLGVKERTLSEILADTRDEAEGAKLDRLMQAIEDAQTRAARLAAAAIEG